MGIDDLSRGQEIEEERTVANTRTIEIVFGLFGVFGLGWLYAGNIITASVLLIFSIFYSIFLWSFLIFSLGTSVFCCCLIIPLDIAIAFISANNARAWAKKTRAQGSALRILAGFAVFLVAVFIGVTLLGATIAGIASQYNPVR